MNVVDPILFHARTSPNAVAICTPGMQPESITYGELEGLMNNVGRMAVSCDLARGQIVAVDIANTIFHLAVVLALTRLGIATVSARSPMLPKVLGVHAVITDAQRPFENAGRVIIADAAWRRLHDRPLADERLYRVENDDLCRVILTSGTTGAAKAVGLTQKMLIDRIPRFDYAMGDRLPFCRRLYSDLGLHSATGFRITLYMLWRGAMVCLFGADSESMVQAFDLFKIEGMLTSPNGLSNYLQFYELPAAPACSFDFILCLGAQMSLSLSERARIRMCPNLYSVYGSTEVTTIASAPARVVAEVPGAVGYVVPDVTVEIVDRVGRVLPRGEEGLVRVRSDYNAAAYIGDQQTSVEAFRDGWFYPGDIGCLTADRMLIIRGRDTALINLGGDKVKPELIEEVLVGSGGVTDAGVFAVPNELGVPTLWAAVVTVSAVDPAMLQKLCATRLGPAYAPVRIVRVPALPKNANGKLDRAKLPNLVS